MTDERTILGTPPLPHVDGRAYVRDYQRSLGVPGSDDLPLAGTFTVTLRAVDRASATLRALQYSLERLSGTVAATTRAFEASFLPLRVRRSGHRHRGTRAWSRRYAHR